MNSYISFILIISFIGWAVNLVLKKLDEIEERAITRHVLLEDWLFQSLYSINNKVLLPDEAEKPLSNKKATVYSPEDDPMNEFKRGDF